MWDDKLGSIHRVRCLAEIRSATLHILGQPRHWVPASSLALFLNCRLPMGHIVLYVRSHAYDVTMMMHFVIMIEVYVQ